MSTLEIILLIIALIELVLLVVFATFKKHNKNKDITNENTTEIEKEKRTNTKKVLF